MDEFYVVGEKYRLLGYKEDLTLVSVDDTYAKFTWFNGLKYNVLHSKRHPHMYKKVYAR